MTHFLDTPTTGVLPASPIVQSTETDFADLGAPDRNLDYSVQVSPGFEALKFAASLLTGVLLLDLTGSDRTVRDRGLESKAQDALDEARDQVFSARPKSQLARLHHDHIKLALSHLERAAYHVLREANVIVSTTSDEIFNLINSAWDELKKTSSLLPGFHTVDLAQSCCAFHDKQLSQAAKR